jgi:hypothetical protein
MTMVMDGGRRSGCLSCVCEAIAAVGEQHCVIHARILRCGSSDDVASGRLAVSTAALADR